MTAPSYRAQVRDAILAAIRAGNTLAGKAVFGPRDWPTAASRLPCVIGETPPRERMTAIVKGPPFFETRAVIPVTARVKGNTVTDVDTQIETLVAQIKAAVFAWQPLRDMIEQIASVEIHTELTSEAREHLGEVSFYFEVEFPERYEPAQGVPLSGVDITVTDQTTGDTLASAVAGIT